MAEITMLVKAPARRELTGFRAEQVAVAWRGKRESPAAEVSLRIDAQWAVLQREMAGTGVPLFNGAISRLLACEVGSRSGAAGDLPAMRLVLGPGDYKTFLITRMRDRLWFEAHAAAAMVRALGNSVLLTNGDQALVGIRSGKVSAYPHRGHLIGGVLEELGTGKHPASVEGIIAHLLLELREEAGVLEDELAPRGEWPRLLAIAEDHFLGQPEAVWRWETRVPLERIARALESGEHAGSQILARGNLPEEVREKLTPMTRLAWGIWAGCESAAAMAAG